MAVASFFTLVAGVVAAIALGIYFFGIPPELKRKLERQALQTMGENKMSHLAKNQIGKLPTSDQENMKQFKKGLNDVVGAGLNNPVGEATGRVANQVWDSVHGYSQVALRRISTINLRGDAGRAQKVNPQAMKEAMNVIGRSQVEKED